jgi:two-component system cell cycle response regulator DivK
MVAGLRTLRDTLPTILIAEDNDLNRELLRELLQAHGYDVREAVNGRQAIDLMRKSRPDVALLDLNMPVLDGFATLKQIRQDPSLFSLPVMAVTASAMRGDREKALEAGFDSYLSKPIDSTILYQELDRILNFTIE